MALSHRPVVQSHPVRAVSRGFAFARTMATGAVASLAYLALAGGAFGPSSDLAANAGVSQRESAPSTATASLSFYGVDPIITGSVDHLFASASFTGPNRAEKTDRVRPSVDALAISRSFEEVRMRLAELRAPSDPAAMGQSS